MRARVLILAFAIAATGLALSGATDSPLSPVQDASASCVSVPGESGCVHLCPPKVDKFGIYCLM